MQYHFGEHRLSETERCLDRGGRTVPVEPKVLDLLIHLVRNRHRLVSRGELMHALWPDVVVGRDALGRIVKEARRAVGDRGDAQTVIETRRGHGYRFVAPVETPDTRDAVDEIGRRLDDAQRVLESALARNGRDLAASVREFVVACRAAIDVPEGPRRGET